MGIYSIYKATNVITGKHYIGFTSRPLEERKRQHINSSKRIKSKFYASANKHGWDNFEWSIIYQSKENVRPLKSHILAEMEPYFIVEYDSYYNGYNSTKGGEGNSVDNMATETRQKISKSRIGRPSNATGHKHTPEQKEKIRTAYYVKMYGDNWMEKLLDLEIKKQKRLEDNIMEEKIKVELLQQKNKNAILSEELKNLKEMVILLKSHQSKHKQYKWIITDPTGTLHYTDSLNEFAREKVSVSNKKPKTFARQLLRIYQENKTSSGWKVEKDYTFHEGKAKEINELLEKAKELMQ